MSCIAYNIRSKNKVPYLIFSFPITFLLINNLVVLQGGSNPFLVTHGVLRLIFCFYLVGSLREAKSERGY